MYVETVGHSRPAHIAADRATQHEYLVLASVSLIALALRVLAFVYWMDTAGDGPARALEAYTWARSPSILSYGTWLPGFTYLSGILSFFLPDPWITNRIVNLILGTCTVPVFYLFVRRLYGPAVALFSAALLAVFPLHVALSVTSLTEVSMLFEVTAGTLLLMRAADETRHRAGYLTLSMAFLLLAVMTRYEAWLLIPLFPAYYFLRTRSVSTTFWMIIVLVSFPIFWIAGNYLHERAHLAHSVLVITSNTHAAPAIGVREVYRGVNALGHKWVDHLGWILGAAVVWGAALQLVRLFARKVELHGAMHLLMVLIPWPLLLYLASTRQQDISGLDRYLLFLFAMSLPFGLFPFNRLLAARPQWLGLLLLVAVASLAVANLPWVKLAESHYGSPLYVTRKYPTEIRNLALWLRQSPYRGDRIVATPLNYEIEYLTLYLPELWVSRIDFYREDSEVKGTLELEHPSIFITRDEDPYRVRAEGLVRQAKHLELVHTEGSIKVYHLTPK